MPLRRPNPAGRATMPVPLRGQAITGMTMADRENGARSALEWITIEGFRSIARIERLELRPINVLIGANGSGKSNFMKAFSLLDAALEDRVREYVGRAAGAERLLHYGSKQTGAIRIRVSFSGDIRNVMHGYEFRMTPDETDNFDVSERFYVPGAAPDGAPDRGAGRVEAQYNRLDRDRNALHEKFAETFGRFSCYHFADTGFSSLMKKTADLHDNRFLRPDGSNLAPFLYLLRERHERSYDLIRYTVRRIAPFFDDFRLEPQALNEDTIRLEWRDRRSDSRFDVSSLSDGTLRYIALAALLLQPVSCRPPVILIDEPELGLHPTALNLMAELVRMASADTQIILSTQSSRMVDCFDPEEILVADRVDGATGLTRPDPARLEKWLEDRTLGELWEMNDFGGTPFSAPVCRAMER